MVSLHYVTHRFYIQQLTKCHSKAWAQQKIVAIVSESFAPQQENVEIGWAVQGNQQIWKVHNQGGQWTWSKLFSDNLKIDLEIRNPNQTFKTHMFGKIDNWWQQIWK